MDNDKSNSDLSNENTFMNQKRKETLEMAAHYEKVRSLKQTSDLFGISPQAILGRFKRLGIFRK
jgi:hypothetical protein